MSHSVLVALNSGRNWNGQYFANFKDLLPEGKAYKEFLKSNEESDVSLITGKVRINETEDMEDDNFALTVQDRRINSLHKKGGGEFLNQRSWQGLEPKIGETEATLVKEGKKGIGWKYDGEPK